eukprot:gnl/Trimastix_PCT/4386.p1 GENE.gnl/Trimastix_PCT/4386~~gnl/Trimastix_PCT/4386.p1  ORF type:complete len:412 (+),score=31.39 gnl/Trimastix_PCT/4386:43-1278(+)
MRKVQGFSLSPFCLSHNALYAILLIIFISHCSANLDPHQPESPLCPVPYAPNRTQNTSTESPIVVLVTGGCGFIGSHFVRYALEAHPNWTIVNLDALTYAGSTRSLDELSGHPRYRFIKGDVTSEQDVRKALTQYGRPAYIFHFAAETHVDVSLRHPMKFTHTNVIGTHTLLETVRLDSDAMRALRCFVHISTDEIYGSLPPRRKGESTKEAFSEADAPRPNNPYSASKASAEMLVRAYRQTFHLPLIITRSSNNFGPNQHPEKLIPHFVTRGIKRQEHMNTSTHHNSTSNPYVLPVYGEGRNERDWLYVRDNCRAIDLIREKGTLGEAYNIAAGNERSNLEVTQRIVAALNLDAGAVHHVPDRKGHDFRYTLDCAKLRTLGWRATTPFETALRETIQWYRTNRAWWEPRK